MDSKIPTFEIKMASGPSVRWRRTYVWDWSDFSSEMPPPSPSNIMVRTPSPFGVPQDAISQVRFPGWGWLLLFWVFGLPGAYVVYLMLTGG